MPASPLHNDPDSPWCYDPRDDEPEPDAPECVYCDDTGVQLVCDCSGVHTCCAPEDRPADCERDERGRWVAPCDCTKEGQR